MAETRVVPEALDNRNYNIWSNCMKVYLLSQDLWDVIESESESDKSSKSWRRKNASALHAIHMSCGSDHLLKIGELESAKEAWEALTTSVNIDDDENVAEEPMETIGKDGIDYDEFVKASKQGDWAAMKEFLNSHPGANVSAVIGGQTALHYVLEIGNLDTFALLAKQVKNAQEFEIQNDEGYTVFARLANRNQPGILKMLEYLFSRNPKLPNVGDCYRLPLVMAAWKGFKETTRYLYSVTDKEVLNPDRDIVGVHVLISCINTKLFDIALKIVKDFPQILQQCIDGSNGEKIYPIHAFAKSLSALKSGSRHKKARAFRVNHWLSKSWKYLEHVKRLLGEEEEMFEAWDDDNKLVHDQAQEFLSLVCAKVPRFDVSKLEECVYAAMIEATRNGVIGFVKDMLIANPILIQAQADDKRMFWHAVESRQEKVYSLIYSFMGRKDSLFSCTNGENNNILHWVARLPPSVVLDRSSGPALQMQRELQWFKEVWSLARPRYREDLNNARLTPRALFTETHAKLIEDGEKAMKDTAQSSTVVGALIITVMFAAAFTVPGGNNQDTGLPVFLTRTLFRIFIVCDALSLYTSTTSVLVFLGILTSRYAEEDFFFKLPRKLMIGLGTLFFSITTMMISFCAALALMLDSHLRYILPTVLLACLPIIIFLSSILPVLTEMYLSTFGTIFDKSGKAMPIFDADKLPVEEEGDKTRNTVVKERENVRETEQINSPSVDKNMPTEIVQENKSNTATSVSVDNKDDKKIISYNPSSVDEIV